AERLPDVPGRGEGIGIAIRALGVHVDQAHLNRAVWLGEIPVAAVALVSEPDAFAPPVDVLRVPHVLAAAAEAEGRQSHRLERAVACEDHQVSPGDLAAVLLLDRPEKPARLVQVPVVRPAIERREALLTPSSAAAAVADAVGARTVPRHPD